MAGVVNTVYCNVIVLRIAPHVREPGFRNPENFCSGIRNTAQEIRNPTNLSHFLILRSVDHLNQLQLVPDSEIREIFAVESEIQLKKSGIPLVYPTS